MRHKYICNFNWTEEFFNEIKRKGYVTEEYEYSMYNKVHTGDILSLTMAKEKSIVICSNWSRRKRGYHSSRKYRIMYKLSLEGWQYIKELIVAQKI